MVASNGKSSGVGTTPEQLAAQKSSHHRSSSHDGDETPVEANDLKNFDRETITGVKPVTMVGRLTASERLPASLRSCAEQQDNGWNEQFPASDT